MSRHLRRTTGLARRAGLRVALAATVLAVVLVVAPAAWADTPTLTDTNTGSTSDATVGDSVSLQPTSTATADVWYDCNTPTPIAVVGQPITGCTAITPAPGNPYTVTNADLAANSPNDYIVVVETDSTGLIDTVSNPLLVHPFPPPQNQGAPSISGSPTIGTTLTANPGSWTGSGISYTYTWYRCASDGSGCTSIENNATYPLASADDGALILLQQTATNLGGSVSAYSSLFGPITPPNAPPPPPSAGAATPSLAGVPQVGSTLVGTPVAMSNNPSYAYQWVRCPTTSSCTAIGGATATTYTPGAADLGDSLQFVETGSNAGGSATVRSPQSANVTSPTETTLQMTPSTIVAGQPVTLIATVTSATGAAPPAGTVLFSSSGTPVKGCNAIATQPSGASATVTCRTTFGSAPSGLSAVFTPAAGSLVTGSNSNSGGFVVGQAPTTTKMTVPRHLPLGHRVTLVAKVHPAPGTEGIAPAGTVVFVDGSTPIKGCVVTLSKNAARCSITYHALGAHTIAAHYLGDATFSGSNSRTHKTTVIVAKPKGYVSALMAWTFRFSPRSTQVSALRATGLVRGDRVAVVCSGDGCPLQRHVYRTTKRSCGKRSCKPLDLAKHLHHARLDVGATLTVRITHRAWLGKYYKFVIRRGRKPKIVTSCLAVGVTQPNIACSPR